MKQYSPEIRIISVDHNLTREAEQMIKNIMEKEDLRYPILNVFCHLEASRCGVSSGKVAVEVDGTIIWTGEKLTKKLALSFCKGLRIYIEQQKKNYSIA